ncbi:TrmH family RNA methyltransferase [Roseiconus lacunae]|uniref:TrmH family RNA methyltransferase n=1 Tax=Roseiconus lacunae TaxID=2605694 RepID=UPI0011F224A0|nr:TrmH family RNA methyltransferase [Roseiconus lacunae]
MLTSLNNPNVKRLVRYRDNRTRRKAKRVIVDGWRETTQAFDAGLKLHGIYTNDNQLPECFRNLGREQVIMVNDAVMEKIAYGQSARGVVAEFESPKWGLEQLTLPDDGIVLVLDQFEKPGNVGAAFRCADAAGVDAVLLCDSLADRFNPNAIRSSLGAVFQVPSATVSEIEAREFLKRQNFKLFAARVESSCELWSANLRGPVAFIIGNEAKGLDARWRSSGRSPVNGIRIPMHGAIDSLNASVSASLLIYEARRQRASVS